MWPEAEQIIERLNAIPHGREIATGVIAALGVVVALVLLRGRGRKVKMGVAAATCAKCGLPMAEDWTECPFCHLAAQEARAAHCLVVVEGGDTGARYPLGETTLGIGRDVENDICLADDAVSKAHARVICRDGTYFLEDLGSRNGSCVNRRRTQRAALRHGDKIQIGASVIEVRLK